MTLQIHYGQQETDEHRSVQNDITVGSEREGDVH